VGAPISRDAVSREMESFVSTKKLADVPKERLLLALDCEMVHAARSSLFFNARACERPRTDYRGTPSRHSA